MTACERSRSYLQVALANRPPLTPKVVEQPGVFERLWGVERDDGEADDDRLNEGLGSVRSNLGLSPVSAGLQLGYGDRSHQRIPGKFRQPIADTSALDADQCRRISN